MTGWVEELVSCTTYHRFEPSTDDNGYLSRTWSRWRLNSEVRKLEQPQALVIVPN